MTTLDQCPSTKGKIIPEQQTQAETPKVWRSLEEYAGTPAFRELVEREFPAGASEMLDSRSRRGFLKVMGAGLALAGAATVPGCRRPERHLMTFAQNPPEEIIPGKPLYYATAICLPGGGAEGLLVETHEGRPTHVEGNPLHPINRGKTSVASKASILDLYDPDRLKYPTYANPARGKLAATWDDFKAWAGDHFAQFDATKGRGLAFVVDAKTSPTRDAMRDAVRSRWPNADWVSWNPAHAAAPVEGTRLAFGKAMRVHHKLANAKCVLSLDADFMSEGPEHLVNARDFAATRVVYKSGDEMSRLYVAESRPSATGSMADHRMALAPSRISAMAVEVAQLVLTGNASAARLDEALFSLNLPAAPERSPSTHAEAIAKDLLAHRGGAVVIAGPSQPAAVHALVAAMNEALGAVGKLVTYTPMSEGEAVDPAAALGDLGGRLSQMDTVVCIDANPVYDAPADSGFAGAFAGVPNRITLSVNPTETSDVSTWALNAAHAFESWGDAQAWDGTIAPVQPMIAPLYAPAMSDIEFLAFLAGPDHGGSANPDGFDLVTGVWAKRAGTSADNAQFQKTWRRALHDGVLAGSGAASPDAKVDMAGVTRAISAASWAPAPTASSLEVVFSTGRVGDGRSANNPWLQELPDVGTSVVWDNPVCLSPATARELGLLPLGAEGDDVDPYTRAQMPQARLATLKVGGREMTVAAWVLPGMPDGVASVRLGYGRTVAGLVGDGVGHNTYGVRPAGAMTASGASMRAAGGTQTIASTQNHWSLEGRTSIVRAMDKKWWDKHAATEPHVEVDPIYGTNYTDNEINVAEKLGEFAHSPEPVSVYENPQNKSRGDAAPGSTFSKPPQWGMTIDLNACSGCGVCTIACQSENNIPVVGKSEVAKGREMGWIRVDRYFTGDLNSPDQMLVQPIACVQCENAPCETVCPVNATVHGPEGINNMAYNRCIGTRYCANNCPYKVRRFNFFDWAQSKFRGGLDAGYVGEEMKKDFAEGLGKDRTFNQNFIPPRLRAKLDEISKMQRNPDVTVRTRGVMEKCTYCVQRINAARQEVKVRGIWNDAAQTGPIPDGFFETACQQACPSDAIVFGDILDPNSRVSKVRESQRRYLLLGYLDTRPRTSHLMRVRNPNPAIGGLDTTDPLGGHGGHEGEGHGEGSHGAEHAGASFIDPIKQTTERGYALSLRVLGGMA